jgi:3-hydroxybutyryl-CoA dehydratase
MTKLRDPVGGIFWEWVFSQGGTVALDDFNIGTREIFAKTVSEADIYLFAGITGDHYGVHVNEEFAKTTLFKHRIAHGALLVGFVSTVMAKMNDHVPPPGGVSVRYEIDFTAPVFIGDTITTELVLSDKNIEKRDLIFSASSTNQTREVVLKGKTYMKLLKKRRR